MKRHPALAPLSRDHHHALVIARRLRRAAPEVMAEAVAAFLAHWEAEERHHFRLEDKVLLPAYAAHADPDHPAVVRTLLDHVLIRRDATCLANGADASVAHALGARLADHVKLEEHELFPLIERTLPESALAALGERLRGGRRLISPRPCLPAAPQRARLPPRRACVAMSREHASRPLPSARRYPCGEHASPWSREQAFRPCPGAAPIPARPARRRPPHRKTPRRRGLSVGGL